MAKPTTTPPQTQPPARAPSQAPAAAAAPAPAPPAAPPAPPAVERFFVVKQRCRVRLAIGEYTLPEGHVLSSRGHDIEELRKLGVPLEETKDPPAPPMVKLL